MECEADLTNALMTTQTEVMGDIREDGKFVSQTVSQAY